MRGSEPGGGLIVLVDMDGPLADFDAHFWERCQAEGFTFDVPHPSHQRHRYFTDHLSDRQERKAARAMVDSPGWFEGLPVTPGAVEGVAAMIAAGWEVWVCTKPLEVNPTCRDAKAAWLNEHFGDGFDRRLIITPDKSLIVGDVLLDDAPKPEWFGRAAWKPVIFSAPYNSHGSEWEGLPQWAWGDPLEALLAAAAAPVGGGEPGPDEDAALADLVAWHGGRNPRFPEREPHRFDTACPWCITIGHDAAGKLLARLAAAVGGGVEAELPSGGWSVPIPADGKMRDAFAEFAGLTDDERHALDQWCYDQAQKRARGVLLHDGEPPAPTPAAAPLDEPPADPDEQECADHAYNRRVMDDAAAAGRADAARRAGSGTP